MNRKRIIFYSIKLFFILGSVVSCSVEKTGGEPYNVLFIAVDDMRTELKTYGTDHIHSPNIDRLARQGVQFNSAFVQQSICMASRASLMTGYRPEQKGIYTGESVKDLVPGVVTLNKLFAQNGYETSAFGKIYHYKSDHLEQFGDNFMDPMDKWAGRGYLTEEAIEQMHYNESHPVKGRNHPDRGPAYEWAEVPDSAYIDGYNTEYALRKLGSYKKGGKPFFMAVGFHKPHLPFVAPKKYWDMYPLESIALPEITEPPLNSTPHTLRSWGELRNYYGMPKYKQAVSEDTTLILRQGYYACVSYVDALIGKLLDRLDQLELADNTIIVLWGDHGYKLGDYGFWCKWSNMDIDTRVPLIFSVPGGRQGESSEAMCELQDIYPTLAELCGLELPAHVEGSSLVPQLNEPATKGKEFVYTVWPHNRWTYDETIMGYSVKSAEFNYTEWVKLNTGEVLDRDLYDHRNDPKETVNVVNEASYQEIALELARQCAVLKGGTDHDHSFKQLK